MRNHTSAKTAMKASSWPNRQEPPMARIMSATTTIATILTAASTAARLVLSVLVDRFMKTAVHA